MACPLPETFGRYRILRPLGEGGMGAVYLVRDTQLDRLVALKVPRLGNDDKLAPDDLKRFFREARAAAALMHHNLCPIFDVGQVDATPYLTMAYIEGHPLSHLVEAGKPISQRKVAVIVGRLPVESGEDGGTERSRVAEARPATRRSRGAEPSRQGPERARRSGWWRRAGVAHRARPGRCMSRVRAACDCSSVARSRR
jgi:hypothetical protein